MKASMGLSRRRMAQPLSVLQLPSDLLDIANRAPLTYRTINEILQLPETEWNSAVRRAANEILKAEDNEQKSELPEFELMQTARSAYRPTTKTEDYILAYRGMKKFVRAIKRSHNKMVIDQVCDEIVANGTKNAEVFIAFNKKKLRGYNKK